MTRSLLVLSLLATTAHTDEPVKRVLLIGKPPDHPARSHEYLPTCRLLAACLNRVEGVEATVSDGWPKEPMDDAAAIVLYRSPFAQAMFEGPRSTEVCRLLDRGAGLVTIHWATGVKPENYERLAGTMTRYQGGAWRSHGGQVAFGESPLTALRPEHPILRGLSLPSIRDEWYFDPELDPDALPFWSVTARGEPLTVAWTHERPRGGRSFATTLGHYWDNFTREPFRRAITNGILWAARVNVPEEGTAVDLEGAVLELPGDQAEADES